MLVALEVRGLHCLLLRAKGDVGGFGMDVLMPQLGETVAEGKVTKWFKSVGDAVKPGENLFEIETDKTSMEVPATFAGTLSEIRFNVGEVAKVGAVVAVIGGTDKAAESAVSGAVTSSKSGQQLPFVPAQPGSQSQSALGLGLRGDEGIGNDSYAYPQMDPFREVRTPLRNYGPAKLPGGMAITPRARRLAGERDIDLSQIVASGPHGRIIARDVEQAMLSSARIVESGLSTTQVKAPFGGVHSIKVPPVSVRRALAVPAETMQTIQHFYATSDIDLDGVFTMLEEANAAAAKSVGGAATFVLSVDDFIVRAWALALQRVPAAKVVWTEDRILRFDHSDIGIAMEFDGGVVIPVLRDVEKKSLTMISSEMRSLADGTQVNQLNTSDDQNGISAIYNVGKHGLREFFPVISPLHATTLAVGVHRRVPIESQGGTIKFITQMSVTLSCDRRVIDAAIGARLLGTFKSLVEKPLATLAE
jgi:pyruvate dehydrogenase E2 component (dihydrolipoamide acetyltransferase)